MIRTSSSFSEHAFKRFSHKVSNYFSTLLFLKNDQSGFLQLFLNYFRLRLQIHFAAGVCRFNSLNKMPRAAWGTSSGAEYTKTEGLKARKEKRGGWRGMAETETWKAWKPREKHLRGCIETWRTFLLAPDQPSGIIFPVCAMPAMARKKRMKRGYIVKRKEEKRKRDIFPLITWRVLLFLYC